MVQPVIEIEYSSHVVICYGGNPKACPLWEFAPDVHLHLRINVLEPPPPTNPFKGKPMYVLEPPKPRLAKVDTPLPSKDSARICAEIALKKRAISPEDLQEALQRIDRIHRAPLPDSHLEDGSAIDAFTVQLQRLLQAATRPHLLQA